MTAASSNPVSGDRCPCRKVSEAVAYAACCGRYHAGVAPAPTAEALMRSRYSAYARENAAYLLATWHATTRPPQIEFTAGQQWLSLKIVSAIHQADTATVAFVARSRIAGRADTFSETSRFIAQGGRWFYVDGAVSESQ